MLSPSVKAIGPIPLMRCCGVWVARWHWSIPKSGAASSMSTSRCPLGWPPAMWWLRPTVAMARIRSSTGPAAAVSHACEGASRQRPRPVELDKDSCHLVIGATGNIGPHLIRQLADMGAGTDRCGIPQSGFAPRRVGRHACRRRATTLVTVAADAADEGAMSALFDRFGTDLPPLARYLSGRIRGRAGDAARHDRRRRHRHVPAETRCARRCCTNCRCGTQCASSCCSPRSRELTGSRWLGHYAATTTFLDTFAYARRAAGLAATAINWGLWKSLTDKQDDQERQVTLDSGLEPMPDEVAIQALASVTGPDAPVRSTIVAADWSPTGHRISHPGSPAHRGRPAARPTTTATSAMPRPSSVKRCAIANRRGVAIFWLIT